MSGSQIDELTIVTYMFDGAIVLACQRDKSRIEDALRAVGSSWKVSFKVTDL